jgi:putative FmdB family regulatory protein
MPLYDYKCIKCGHYQEVLVFNKAIKIVCEKCNSDKLEKQISRANGYVKNTETPART